MNIYFSGIGGTGIGPLALISHQAGYIVSGSDKQESDYISYLRSKGIKDISIGQSTDDIEASHERLPIDWLVYSSAVEKENPNHPELVFARNNGIKTTKRDELINYLLDVSDLKMIAIAGTHGKTTTTAMMVWLMKNLEQPTSYSVGAKISFGEMGEFERNAQYFIYEADEYDRNFLSFRPEVSIIPGLAYDHADIYPTQNDYDQAFIQFFGQSNSVVIWREDAEKLQINSDKKYLIVNEDECLSKLSIPGKVNRMDAVLCAKTAEQLKLCSLDKALQILNSFPGVSRRFEKITENLYTDYAHTPEKIQGSIQLAREVGGDSVVVVYEGLHNTRQHFIRDQLKTLFAGVKKLYVVPSYLAREDKSLEMLTPDKLCEVIEKPIVKEPAILNEQLKEKIQEHANLGDLVVCFSAGGGDSLDEWLRREFAK